MPEQDAFTQVGAPASSTVGATGQTSNPQDFLSRMNVNDQQKQNIESMTVGAGTAVVHRMLTPVFGEEIAGGVGGLVSAILAKQIKQMINGGR